MVAKKNQEDTGKKPARTRRRLLMVAGISAWTLGGFFVGQFIAVGALLVLQFFGIDFAGVNEAVFNAVTAAVCYVLALAIVIGVPWLARRHKTTKEDVGLQRLPTWTDLGLAPVGMVAYFITSGVMMYFVMSLFPGFDISEAQDVGFTAVSHRYEYILAFVTLVVIAPFAEEVLFRGYLYGKLKKYVPWWGAALVTSALFGLAHGQWNVAVDTFVLGMFLCILRDVSGSLWPAVVLHMIKNGIAYYFLFINPTLINTLGG